MKNSEKTHNRKLVMLKWPGGKSKLADKILSLKQEKDTLIEPFMGSGSVFLNIGENFKKYIGNDNNSDLILLFNEIKKNPHYIIKNSKRLFQEGNNKEFYNKNRDIFNSLDKKDPLRAVLFVYLNRHGFNGLCRYSIKKGTYNVPFGRYLKPYFPEMEILEFHRISNSIDCEFFCSNFPLVFNGASDSLIYSDPPFLELSKTASFKNYSGSRFTISNDSQLNELSFDAIRKGNVSVVSNHLTDNVLDIYDKCTCHEVFESKRNISCKERKSVSEILMIYK